MKTITNLKLREKDLKNVVIVDPAKTVKLHSDDSAIVGVGVSRSSHAILVRKVVSGKFRPADMYEQMFKMIAQLRATVLAVEVTSLNEFITQPIENEIARRSIPVRFVKLHARAKKEDRIAALAAYYQHGYIYHNPECCDKLETQLLGFPRSRLWDVMDAFAYTVELLDLESDFFEPADIDDEQTEEDFSELEHDPVIKNWRLA